MTKRERKKAWTYGDADGLMAYQSTPPPNLRQLEPEDIDVVFQPIVDLATTEIFAQEVLVRCGIEELRSPLVLFDHAMAQEACGRLGRMIRERALEVAPKVPMFTNIHPKELSSRWLVRPDDPISFHEAPVYLEITETAAFEHFELCQYVLREVCQRTGAKLVIDDFGAGYSSLSRIVELEPAVVKLDRSLIVRLHERPRSQILVRNVVRLCEELDATVVAEGVEELDELRAVIDAGVHYGQGFLLARPGLPPPEAIWPL